MNAETLMVIGGFSAFAITIYGVRSRELRENYAILWILISFLPLLGALFPGFIVETASAFRLAGPTAVLFIVLPIVYLFSFYICISLTRLSRRNTRLVQELAILEERLRHLEALQLHGAEPEWSTDERAPAE